MSPTAAAAAITTLGLLGVGLVPGAAAGEAVTGPSATARTLAVADRDLTAPALSFSGRFVAYYSSSRVDASAPVRLRRADLVGGGSVLLNRSLAGGPDAGNYSAPPVISGAGDRVSFSTNADQLVAGDTNGRFDAFVRDVPGRSTLLASVSSAGTASDGNTGMASMSKNGRFVVFTSSATDVVPGSTTTNADVYRRDLETGTTVQVTVRPNGAPSRGPGSSSTDVSANGQVVAFNSYDTDLAPVDGADGEADLFVRFMGTGQTRWLSAGVPEGANPSGVVISPNGRWVSSRWEDGSLHLTRVGTGATATVAAEGYALLGAFSSLRGRYVFVSGGAPFVRDLATGVDTPIAVPPDGFVTTATISGNGRYAAFDWTPAAGGATQVVRVAL